MLLKPLKFLNINLISLILTTVSTSYAVECKVGLTVYPGVLVKVYHSDGTILHPNEKSYSQYNWCFSECDIYRMVSLDEDFALAVTNKNFLTDETRVYEVQKLVEYIDVCEHPSTFPSNTPSKSPQPSSELSLRPSTNPSHSPFTPPSPTPSLYPTSSSAPTQCEDETHWYIVEPPMHCGAFSNDFECGLFEGYINFGMDNRQACCVCGGGRYLLPEPSGLPTSSPSSMPSSGPSSMPSNEPSVSSIPSQLPTSAPSDCKDDSNWMVTTASNREIRCELLSSPRICKTVDALGAYYGKVASEACCICGGSNFTVVGPSTVPSGSVAPSEFPSAKPSVCVDEPQWVTGGPEPLACGVFTMAPKWCAVYASRIAPDGKSANDACCACGGGKHKDVPPSTLPTSHPSMSLTPSIEPTSQPSSVPSVNPTATPSILPSRSPSVMPSTAPTMMPSLRPSRAPSTVPTNAPSNQPSLLPSSVPSTVPSLAPSILPSSRPTMAPSAYPSIAPSTRPSTQLSKQPSLVPSSFPVATPSMTPSFSLSPFAAPSPTPTSCIDELGWQLDGLFCKDITVPDLLCHSLATFEAYEGKTASMACCACGGGTHLSIQPSNPLSPGPTVVPSSLLSAVPSVSPSQHSSTKPSASYLPSTHSRPSTTINKSS